MTWINFSDIQKRVPIMAVMSRYGVELKRTGTGYRGACPIPKNGKPGQFGVLPEEGLQREELIMLKAYEESTKYLEGVLTLIIGSDNASGTGSS